MQREELARLISQHLAAQSGKLRQFYTSSGPIGHFILDDLLPPELAARIAAAFPTTADLTTKNTMRERKYVSSQMNRHDPLIEEALFAFQSPDVVSAIQEITGHPTLYADPLLYAGGVSLMEEGGFLNPHIDNSHDKHRERWRALNLLYYVSSAQDGGELELWPHGMKAEPVVIEARFNRLVVMATHHRSLHSVRPIRTGQRRCISNYYFSDTPMRADQTFHVTSFRGRPEQPVRDLALQADAHLRNALRRIKWDGFFTTGHWYQKART